MTSRPANSQLTELWGEVYARERFQGASHIMAVMIANIAVQVSTPVPITKVASS